MITTAEQLIDHLGLAPLGFEGGFFRETYRSQAMVTRASTTPEGPFRAAGTAIYYLLTTSSRSFLHRLRTDETYHFYLGDPVDMLRLDPEGGHHHVVLGPSVLHGQHVQYNVPAEHWQGSQLQPGGQFALLGTTMAPGFELNDFELGSRPDLVSQYPQAASTICSLTPETFLTSDFILVADTINLRHATQQSQEALRVGLGALSVAPEWTIPPFAQTLSISDVERWWYVLTRSDRQLIGWIGYQQGASPRDTVELRHKLPTSIREIHLRQLLDAIKYPTV